MTTGVAAEALPDRSTAFTKKVLVEPETSLSTVTWVSVTVTFFTLFTQEAARLKAYLIELVKDPKWLEHPEQRSSQILHNQVFD